jgi:hypothetical protein
VVNQRVANPELDAGIFTKNGSRLVPPFVLNQLNICCSAASLETNGAPASC